MVPVQSVVTEPESGWGERTTANLLGLTGLRVELFREGVVQHCIIVCAREIVENKSLLFMGAIDTCPAFPGFFNNEIKAIAVIGAENIPVSFFI